MPCPTCRFTIRSHLRTLTCLTCVDARVYMLGREPFSMVQAAYDGAQPRDKSLVTCHRGTVPYRFQRLYVFSSPCNSRNVPFLHNYPRTRGHVATMPDAPWKTANFLGIPFSSLNYPYPLNSVSYDESVWWSTRSKSRKRKRCNELP